MHLHLRVFKWSFFLSLCSYQLQCWNLQRLAGHKKSDFFVGIFVNKKCSTHTKRGLKVKLKTEVKKLFINRRVYLLIQTTCKITVSIWTNNHSYFWRENKIQYLFNGVIDIRKINIFLFLLLCYYSDFFGVSNGYNAIIYLGLTLKLLEALFY
jgi:hypothetical protein